MGVSLSVGELSLALMSVLECVAVVGAVNRCGEGLGTFC